MSGTLNNLFQTNGRGDFQPFLLRKDLGFPLSIWNVANLYMDGRCQVLGKHDKQIPHMMVLMAVNAMGPKETVKNHPSKQIQSYTWHPIHSWKKICLAKIFHQPSDFPEILGGFHGPFPLLNHHHHLEAQGPVFSEPASVTMAPWSSIRSFSAGTALVEGAEFLFEKKCTPQPTLFV